MPKIKAVVLVVNSPGGDALASDLVWRAVRRLAAVKPVVACMTDVAASGGYYIAMAANAIVAQPLTLTGSIGVVAGKVSLAGLYEKTGYAKETIARGRYAELLSDARTFTDDERELFEAAVAHAYSKFRDKAAESRGMEIDTMEAVAQGRVWVGGDALQRGLVDTLGGVSTAVAMAARLAGVPEGERVAQLELSRARVSPLALVTGGRVRGGARGGGGGGRLCGGRARRGGARGGRGGRRVGRRRWGRGRGRRGLRGAPVRGARGGGAGGV